MTIKSNWKQWSIPFCLTVSLTAGHVQGQQLSPAADGAALTAPNSLVAGTLDEAELAPVPEGDAEMPQALEPEPLAAEETAEPAATKKPAPRVIENDTSEVIEERYANGALKL